jgi:hypothetical protein
VKRIYSGEIPPRGWKDILWRAWGESSDPNLLLIAGGVTYAILLALFPRCNDSVDSRLRGLHRLCRQLNSCDKTYGFLAGIIR